MKTTTLSAFAVACLFLFNVQAQAQTIIKGVVHDEGLIPISFTTVSIEQPIKVYCFSDDNGMYTLQLPDSLRMDTVNVIFNMIGYLPDTLAIILTNPVNLLNCELQDNLVLLQSVNISELSISNTSDGLVRQGRQKKGKKNYNSNGYYSFTPSYPLADDVSTEEYAHNNENAFEQVDKDPVTTMSIDVDNASYANVRRYLNLGTLPPADAVRVEEMVNYFTYHYPEATEGQPYVVYTELAPCPWNPQHQLLHVGFRGKSLPQEAMPPSNFVFLVDVSGSMDDPNKLPLVKSSLRMLVNNLGEDDRVSIVVYAGQAGVRLESTKGSNKQKIMDAIDGLVAGGSTAGGEGIQLAYKIARENLMKDGNNRVILCTDGDFNVGVSTPDELEKLISEQKDNGVFLTCLGFGMGNLKDNKLETLADKGNGNYGYIDNIQEANRMLVSAFGSTMFTVAKDMKVQIEFNPVYTAAYRLIGYENRMLENEDFENDEKDGGELGSGQTVTTLYEIIPAGIKDTLVTDKPALKYQVAALTDAANSGEIATIKVRYKEPDGDKSIEGVFPVKLTSSTFEGTTADYQFSAAVALFGMLLQDSQFSGTGDIAQVISIAQQSKGDDTEGYRAEFVRLAKTAPIGQ